MFGNIHLTCRRGKKAPKGKKCKKQENEAADTPSSAVRDEAKPGIKLKAKQRKKLLKEVSIQVGSHACLP